MAGALYYIPFAHRDWLSSSRVRRMPLAAQGAFVSLLCYQWEDGAIPAEAEEVGRVLGVSGREMTGLWAYLEPAFPLDADGLRRNPRLAREREEAHQKVERNRRNGGLGGRTPRRKASVSSGACEGDLFEGDVPEAEERSGEEVSGRSHEGVLPSPPSPSSEGTSPTGGGGRSPLVRSSEGDSGASSSLLSASKAGGSGKHPLPFRLSENEAIPEPETEPQVPEPSVPAGGGVSRGGSSGLDPSGLEPSGNASPGNGERGTGNGVGTSGAGRSGSGEASAGTAGAGGADAGAVGSGGAETAFERVRRTLALVARGTGMAEPSSGAARRFLAEGRGLVPLLRRVEPEEAAALYLWCGRHFPGGKSWGTIGDHLGIYRRQMREGVASLYGGAGLRGAGSSSAAGRIVSGQAVSGRMSLEEQMREARDAE